MGTQTWTPSETKTGDMAPNAGNAKAGTETLAEGVAGRTPSLLFPIAALASIAASATLQIRGHRQMALFVGQWASGFLLFGLYNKAIKALGAD